MQCILQNQELHVEQVVVVGYNKVGMCENTVEHIGPDLILR